MACVPATVGYLSMLGNKLYATGIWVNRILENSLDGQVKLLTGDTLLTTLDGGQSQAAFHAPNGIFADKKNRRLIVSEWGGGFFVRSVALQSRFKWWR